MFDLFDYWFQVRIHGFRNQDSGFRKRAVNHSLITRQFILWYIRFKQNHNSTMYLQTVRSLRVFNPSCAVPINFVFFFVCFQDLYNVLVFKITNEGFIVVQLLISLTNSLFDKKVTPMFCFLNSYSLKCFKKSEEVRIATTKFKH